MPPDNTAGSPTPIVIDALDPETMALWRTVARIAQALDDQDVRWCLVGGLMVALFAIEAGQISRPTSTSSATHASAPAQPNPSPANSPSSARPATKSAASNPRRASAPPSTARSSTSSPRTGAMLTAAERRWLRAIETQLNLADRDLDAIVDAGHLRVARAA